MRIFLIPIAICCLCVSSGSTLLPISQSRTTEVVKQQWHPESRHPTKPRSPFRYAIIRDRTLEGTYYPQGGNFRFRSVDVLLDAKSFSEESLRQLVKLLSKRIPDPEELLVNIYTNLDDVSTPEEAEYISPPGSAVDLSTPKYAWAFYIRNSDGEHFRYHTKEPGSIVKTVNLRDKEQ